MSLDSFRYPIEYITIKMFTTYLVVAKQFSEQISIFCPHYSVLHGLYHLGSRAPFLALSRVLLSTRSLFATNALQEPTVRNAACANPVQILKVLELMDCEDGYESSVRRLPHIDVRRHVQYENELDAATIQRFDNVFRKGIKSNDLGKVKISVDGVFARLDELQKAIRLSELPLELQGRYKQCTRPLAARPKLQ